MPTVREYEAALQRNPADAEVFAALRKAYRQAQQHDRLVVLYETRAQAIDDGSKAAELFYLAAELRLDQLGDPTGAEADLANAVDRDPTHIRATSRLKDIYREQGRTPDYMAMLEMEAAAVARTHDPARIAELQSEMGQLFVNHFARLERSVRNTQRPTKLTADHVKAIESARKIYRALGDYRNVVRLYELELEGTTDAKRRADLLLAIGRVLAEKLEELDAAAQRLGEVVRLRPRDDKALELLASIYANPNWVGADGPERSAALSIQVACRRHETGDDANAVAALRKALSAVPGHVESSALLEDIYRRGRQFHELDRYFRERIAAAASNDERIEFLYKRAELSERDLADKAEAQRIYGAIALLEPPTGPAWQRLAELLGGSGDYAKLAELREKQLEAIEDPEVRVPIMAELATLYRDRLGDKEQAAVYLHAVLQIEPDNEAVQKAYADHFREKGDWNALVELLEFSVEQAQARNAPIDEVVRQLEEVATTAEKNLTEPARALDAWRRIEDLQPSYARAREAQRRLLLKDKNWEGMAGLLEREAALQTEPGQRAETLRRAAQIHREKLRNSARAIEIYKDILRAEPHDAVALRALVEIFEREEDFAGLAKTLREQIDLTAAKQEKVSLLRRLLAIDDERLANLTEGAWAATEILQIVPGDRDTLTRLEGILERAGDHAKLVEVLEQHTAVASNTDEKVPLVRQVAEIYQTKLADLPRAAEHWEEVARLDPGDARALEALTTIYTESEKLPELARVLDLQVERLSAEPAQQAECVRRLALLSEGPLHDLPRAQKYWETLIELSPTDGEALDALSRIYENDGDWATLIRILDRRVALAKEPARAAELALLRAKVLDEELQNPVESAQVLEHLIAELDPRNLTANQRLRALYERAGDWERVVKVAERQLFLIEDPAARAPHALEVGLLWRDRLHDDRKAVTAFERVLEIDSDNLEAITALGPLYAQAGDWQRLIFTDEKLLDRCEEPLERRRLMLEIARLSEREMGEPRRAFEWLKRAYAESPDEETLRLVDEAAAKHSLNEELIQIYEGSRARAADPAAQLAAALKIAVICEDKLHDPARAFSVLREALPSDPTGRELLPLLEGLAERTSNWTGLLEVYAAVARARPEQGERVELLRLRAGVREKNLGDPAGALDETMRAFVLQPQNLSVQDEVLRLARATGRWEDALTVQGQLFALADDLGTKLTVARNAAQLVEVEVKDLVRAFRAYLNAFRLAPDDPEITGHLWRLAAAIGRFEIMEPATAAAPTPAPVAAHPAPVDVDLDDLHVAESVDDSGALELSDDELFDEVDEDGGAGGADGAPESTAADAEADATIPMPRVPTPLPGPPRTKTIPPPPPAATQPPPTPVRRPPERPARATFETPWEELAAAYESLPPADTTKRHQRLLKIAEIWERGQHDITRAVNTLERAFRLNSDDPVTRRELERLAKAHDLWDRLAAIYLGSVDEFSDAARSVALHHDVARMREGLGQVDKAEALYEAILRLKSDDREALDGVETIYRDQHRWQELANLLERRTSGALESKLTAPLRRSKFRELAELYEVRLEKPYEAIGTLEKHATDLRNQATNEANDEAGIAEAGNGATANNESSGADSVRDSSEALRAETLAVSESLSRMYSRVGLWAKVVDNVHLQAELTADRSRARALRLQLASIYEAELGLPDRAIDAYQAILTHAPDDGEALSALDRLLEAHGRFETLQEVLAKRAALSSGEQRLKLVRRRAKILEEKMGNPEAAAACLRDLGADAIADNDLLAALVRNLRRAGLAHEAARILGQKIDAEKKRRGRAARARVAALNLELSLIKLDDLNDADGARESVEAALVASPENLAALAALARLYLKANDFEHYAETRGRQARALAKGDKAAAVEALLDAGRVYGEQVASAEKARASFEEALKLDPHSTLALRALASALAAQGAWEDATFVLNRQLELTEAPEGRAAILTELGRAAWEGANDAATATRRLEEALALVPDRVPAIALIADIYYKEGQWENAEKRLTEAVRWLRGQPPQMALLYQRLAEVHERLGKLEDAYRQLLEADRMGPGQLMIKLALGENRFRASKWREAAQHLSVLGDHPDAAGYPEEVADALAHGAQAEIKQRRPERAIALYEAALRLRPTHQPSLRALADLGQERGEPHQAATYLRRLADATKDPADRAALLEQLGDRYVDVAEPPQALAAYGQALALGGEPSDVQVPLLEKTLKLQRTTGDIEGAARTSKQLLDLVKDPQERTTRRREAALLMAEQDAAGALILIEQMLEESPVDERALAMLCDVSSTLGRKQGLEQRLASVLPELPAPPADDAEAIRRRADLWEHLGSLRLASGADGADGALGALVKAIELDPRRLTAREKLAGLYGEGPEHADAAAENLRVLLAADVARPDGLRALAGYYARRGLIDRARCCYEVLDVLDAAEADERAFLAAHPTLEMKPDDPYPGAVDEADRAAHLTLPESTKMAEVFSSLWEGTPGLAVGQTVEELGVSAQDKISPMSDLDLGKIYGQVSKALGNKKTALYIKMDGATFDLAMAVQSPPALVIGPELGLGARHAEMRFQIGRGIELTRPEYILAAGLPPREFAHLFASVLKAYHPRHSRRPANPNDASNDQMLKLKRSVPYKISKRLAELFGALGSTAWSSIEWRSLVQQTGNRAGLLVCGQLKTAVNVVLAERPGAHKTDGGEPSGDELRRMASAHQPLKALLQYAISEDYFHLREKLGTAVVGAVAA
ncbi:MAG TPA: tetratricopeptide repeat protein [Polyangia bacterium]|jgi:tetratricopeptide (TPR) repeat protein|nr:tetratricopeptide repeat protein [Polyangia bacterium]